MSPGQRLVGSISMEPWFSAKNLFFPQTRREFLRTSAIGLSGLTLGIPTPVQAADDNPRPLVDRVRRAIERGVQFLRDQENHNGNWELAGGLASMRPGGGDAQGAGGSGAAGRGGGRSISARPGKSQR